MALAVRMILYFAFSTLANQGFVLFDQAAGTVSFQIEDVIMLATGLAGFIATFAWSRWSKAHGGKT